MGTSLRRWADRLSGHARSAAVAAELPFWRGVLEQPSLRLSPGGLDPARDVLGTAGRLRLSLPSAVTGALLTRVAAAFHGGINEVLLTGLAVAVVEFCGRRGESGGASAAVLLELEGHGREEAVFADADLTRTVGWFTSLAPLRLDLSGLDVADAVAGGASLGRALKRVKEAVRGLPGKGLGYGLLRYPEPAERAGAFRALRAGWAAAFVQLPGTVRRAGLGRLVVCARVEPGS